MFVGIEFRAFIIDNRTGTEYAKAMGKVRGDVEAPFVLTGEDGAMPIAKAGRMAPDINGHIEDLTGEGPDQLSLRSAKLIV